MYSLFTKITYILTFPPTSLKQFLRAIWNAVSWGIVLILPQIKQLTTFTLCIFLKANGFLHGFAVIRVKV